MTWHTDSSREVYGNQWIRVREDDVVGPSGPGIYGVVEMRHPAVFVVAVDDEDQLCLVTMERYTTGRSIEVPAGGSDGEDPLVAAKREFHEETGCIAAEWTLIGRMNALNGIAVAPEFVFLARGVSVDEEGTDERADEGIDTVSWVPFAEVLAMIGRGDITDGETVAAITYAGIHLGRFT